MWPFGPLVILLHLKLYYNKPNITFGMHELPFQEHNMDIQCQIIFSIGDTELIFWRVLSLSVDFVNKREQNSLNSIVSCSLCMKVGFLCRLKPQP